jgi:hypothetical protein
VNGQWTVVCFVIVMQSDVLIVACYSDGMELRKQSKYEKRGIRIGGTS